MQWKGQGECALSSVYGNEREPRSVEKVSGRSSLKILSLTASSSRVKPIDAIWGTVEGLDHCVELP